MHRFKVQLQRMLVGAALIALAFVLLSRPEDSGLAANPGSARTNAPVAPKLSAYLGQGRARPQVAKALRPGRRTGQNPTGKRTVATLSYGNSEAQLGRELPQEANPQGVASLTLTQDHQIVLLDRVNGRLLTLDAHGHPKSSIKLDLTAPQEVIAQDDGSLLVMDRLVDQTVLRLDPDLEATTKIPIVGPELEHAGSATGLFADASGIYIEHEHGKVVRIADEKGQPDPHQPTMSGRPSHDQSSLVSAHLSHRAQGAIYVRTVDRATETLKRQRRISFDETVFSIRFLDTDASGNIYVGAHVGTESQAGEILDESIKVVCLDANINLIGKATLPPSSIADENFRDISVGETGEVFYLHRQEQGVSVEAYRCV